jgi:putative aminopeptidase FrvX
MTTIKIDVTAMIEFLVGLLNTPSPTGYAGLAIDYVQAAFASLPFEMQRTPKGLLVGTWAGQRVDSPRAVTAHVDTLGAMVSQIKANGRLRLSQLGGWAWGSVEGEGVTVFTSEGGQIRGTILPTTASAHAHSLPERQKPADERMMEVRLDVRTNSAHETLALGVRVGDFIAFDPRVELSESGFIRSRHLDDKAGVATIYGALQAIAAAGLTPKQRTTLHLSHYEEVGHGAATGFPPDLAELLTVDMAVVAPGQQCDEFSVGICAKDSRGPYHLDLRRRLERLAEAEEIPYQTDVYPFYGSDGEAYWRAGGDVQVALIGPGVDASHHYERTHRESLEHTARLIAAYLLN